METETPVDEIAKHLATEAHEKMRPDGKPQLRDTGAPYITHPARVADKIGKHRLGTAILKAAAWLHDTLEDTLLTAAMIEKSCGAEVRKLVEELTNQFTKENYPHLNRKNRKEAEFKRLRGVSQGAKLIKMVDRLDNLGEMNGLEPDRIVMYARESLKLVEAVGDADPLLEAELTFAAKQLLRTYNGGIEN